ncbi:MAG: energy-coupling factor transporter ATPase [Bacilli bacterium]|nr:energy-coupling factor transporter ATPase [Bacilli bacterium]
MKKIEVKNLKFAYNSKETVINGLNFSVEAGKYVSILGHNGSGKSTLAKLLMGLLVPGSGEIFVDGKLLSSETVDEIRLKMALVFQNPDNQFIGSTVEEDVAFGLENRKVPQKEMHDIIFKYLRLVGMEEFYDKEPSNLSGGQKQRVAIAGALALNPDILILDEATSMLDPKGKREINELINSLRDVNPELTIISITHDVNEALFSDEIVLISSGKVSKVATPEEIFSDEALLTKNNVISPFVYQIKNRLIDMGIDASNCKTMDEMVELIWQSK